MNVGPLTFGYDFGQQGFRIGNDTGGCRTSFGRRSGWLPVLSHNALDWRYWTRGGLSINVGLDFGGYLNAAPRPF